MSHTPRILSFALISVVVAGSGLAASKKDEVYSCRDVDGNIILQTDPCPKPIDTETRPGPPAPVRPSIPAPQQPAARPSVPPVSRAPVRFGTTAPPPPRRSTSGWTVIPRSRSTPPAPRRALGKQSFPTSLAGVPRPTSPSFASPELTWRTFVAAIEGGDRTAAGACLTPAALEKLGPDVESIPLEDLRTMLSLFTRNENGGDHDPFWSIYGVRANQRPKWIFFEQTASGEWKIAGI